MSAQRALLPGHRWHFSQGPIDLVIGADGDPAVLRAAHQLAWRRFVEVLPELVGELPLLRQPVGPFNPLVGPIARRMFVACAPYREGFITSMAAVAGAVADEIIGFYRVDGIERASVNNGGDIALHLAEGASLRVGLCADVRQRADVAGRLAIDGTFVVDAAMPIRGIATSGWRGRSFSFGIADSVTVLARTAAEADAAATVIANAVDVDDPRIVRRPADELKDDSDLGARCVTTQVPQLEEALVEHAIAAGLARAAALYRAGLIRQAAIVCQGRARALLHDHGLPPTTQSRRVDQTQFGFSPCLID